MRASLVWQPLRASIWLLAALAAGWVAFILVATLTYQSLGAADFLAQFMSRMPRAIRGLVGDENVLTPAGYFGTMFFHPLALLFQGGTVVALVTRLAQDTEIHTADLLLTHPVTRTGLALSRLAAALTGFGCVTLLGLTTFLIGRALTPSMQGLETARIALAFAYDFLLWTAITAAGFLASCVVSTRGAAIARAVGFAGVSYLLNFFGQMWAPMEPLRVASVFYYFRSGVTLGGGSPPLGYPFVLLGVSLACVLLGLLIYRERDITG